MNSIGSLLRQIFRRRNADTSERGTFVMDAQWSRTEELRPDRLGPSHDDVQGSEKVRADPWRPARTLGPLS